MRTAAMRCCASKRSTSTRSEAGGDATPKASIESGVAARAGAHSISIVDSIEDESRAPRGWPGGTDPCSSDDGGARTSTSAFAEGCVAVDADAVARSKSAREPGKAAGPSIGGFSVGGAVRLSTSICAISGVT